MRLAPVSILICASVMETLASCDAFEVSHPMCRDLGSGAILIIIHGVLVESKKDGNEVSNHGRMLDILQVSKFQISDTVTDRFEWELLKIPPVL